MKRIVIFGSTGSIGKYLCDMFIKEGHEVLSAPRNGDVSGLPDVDVAIWCQGMNLNDSIETVDYNKYLEVLDVNLNYIVRTLSTLVFREGARCLIVSSLWQEFSRTNKFSYTVSKAALGGIVRSCSVDLGARGIFINSILPGPIKNEMTLKNLSSEQIAALPGFVQLEDLWHLARYLCLYNTSMNGQSLIVDLGFSVRKL